MFKEFKEFAVKGNVIDLAVGVIIGGAFGKIVSSLVNDILMPVIGFILSGINISDLKFVIKHAVGDVPEVAILYGSFIQAIVDFLIIAFSIFMFLKLLTLGKKKKEQEAPPAPPAEPDPEIKLLEEIRDLLKDKE
ncbi:MAG TPA: large-conductance mechanosensitive channel protein MscL [Clostridiaceae bacterium]|nr:large-conductance mechanosensitive channel protein MscL [Clostridiaceae bacterium]